MIEEVSNSADFSEESSCLSIGEMRANFNHSLKEWVSFLSNSRGFPKFNRSFADASWVFESSVTGSIVLDSSKTKLAMFFCRSSLGSNNIGSKTLIVSFICCLNASSICMLLFIEMSSTSISISFKCSVFCLMNCEFRFG